MMLDITLNQGWTNLLLILLLLPMSAPQTNVVEYFLCIGSVKYTRAGPPARKMSLFSYM